MKSQFHYIVENCGNFSAKVLPGMIAYSRETKTPIRHRTAHSNLPPGDGYATREHDIQVGGFLYRQCAKEATEQGSPFSSMSVEDKQSLALKMCRKHIKEYGEVGHESYCHWLKRALSFAKHHHIEVPQKEPKEASYPYFQRIKSWVRERPERFPQVQKGVGTHLVFSPDPKIWRELRAQGLDERQFLKEVLAGTMKELHDWRRKMLGPGHSLGWVAGTHVVENGADRHPHIHVVVLKRDEAGKEVDWSVSVLKGRKGRGHEPDPMSKTKDLFQKNVEKTYENYIGREPGAPRRTQNASREMFQIPGRHPIARRMNLLLVLTGTRRDSELGMLIRLYRMSRIRDQETAMAYTKENLPTLIEFKKWIEKEFPKLRTQSLKKSPEQDLGIEPEL